MKKLISTTSINLGNWKSWSATDGRNRGDGWIDTYFQEIAFDFSWLPKNCYGRWAIEMKEINEKETDIDICLGWQKAVRDGGAGICTPFKGSELKLSKYPTYRAQRWELYESDYFPIPEHDGPVLIWLLRRHNDPTGTISVAMWTLALFEEIPDPITPKHDDLFQSIR